MANTFTPEQIAQILEEFFNTVGTRQYIGPRIVPLLGRKGEDSIEWDNTAPYEPLTIVLYQGNSYTSRQYVPVGVEISNQEFWAETGNYNAQIEQYRRETAAAKAAADAAQEDIDTLLPKSAFSTDATVKDYIDSALSTAKSEVLSKTPAINPESFEGSDYEKLQAAIDYAKENDFPTVVVSKDYDITGYTLDMTKGTSYESDSARHRKNLTMLFMGNGCITKRDAGFVFSATRYSGDYEFINMHVRGNADKGGCSVFDVSKLIRIKTYGCFYERLGVVFDGSRTVLQEGEADNAQTVRCYGDTAFLCASFFLNRNTYDVLLDGCTIEECTSAVTIDKSFDVALNTFHAFNCCIESCDIAFDLAADSHTLSMVHTKIQNCYFEANGVTPIKIDPTYCYNLSVENNYFAGSLSDEHCIEINCRWYGIIVSGNDGALRSDGYLIYFTDDLKVPIYSVINTFRGGKLSNKPTRISSALDDMRFTPNQSLQFNNEVVIGYSNAQGTVINFSVPLPKIKPAGLRANFALTANPVIVCDGQVLNPALENFTLNTATVNDNNSNVYCSGELQSGYKVAANSTVALRITGTLSFDMV